MYIMCMDIFASLCHTPHSKLCSSISLSRVHTQLAIKQYVSHKTVHKLAINTATETARQHWKAQHHSTPMRVNNRC